MQPISQPRGADQSGAGVVETRGARREPVGSAPEQRRNRVSVDPVLRRLNAVAPLSAAETAAVERLADSVQARRAGTEMSPDSPSALPWVLHSGWAAHLRFLPDGRRQIFDFVLPGDIVGLRSGRSPLEAANIVALTDLKVANGTALVEAARDPAGNPSLAAALEACAFDREARILDQVVRLGRLNAHERVGHLLLQIRERLSKAKLCEDGRFPLPVTQECLSDAVGLSLVHLNRVLQQLRRDGLIEISAGQVRLLDPDRLAALSQYG